jgi:hypothetical protein
MARRNPAPLCLLLLSLFSCSSGKPPDVLFFHDIQRMILLDRELGFEEEISEVKIVGRTAYEDQVEVEVRVSGWAIHPDLTIGAALPAAKERKPSWATWKYFCRKKEKKWIIEEKYKVDEGFM